MNSIQITEHFNIVEFACKDGTEVPQQYFDNVIELCRNLEVLRDELCCPIHVNSGYRSISHNKKVGGKEHSQHLVAKAADITTKNFSPLQVWNTIKDLIKKGKMKDGGLGLYNGFVHYDVRDTPARW